ncbi:SRPBCC family protein [Arthrobacter sp. KN11-1C]|uniref:SRPBCC family protein n=1 Tax=Arthrobacter sp. KN11-1C TaxID=3445774 RepID=UPI003FA0F62C
MNDVHGSINVNVPVRLTYEQWTRFEEFPLFLSGVESVTRIGDVRLRFKMMVGGVPREYDAWIIAREPDEQITWESVGHPLAGGTVLLEPMGPTETKVLLRLNWEPDSLRSANAEDQDALQVRQDLERFKEIVERPEGVGFAGRITPARES